MTTDQDASFEEAFSPTTLALNNLKSFRRLSTLISRRAVESAFSGPDGAVQADLILKTLESQLAGYFFAFDCLPEFTLVNCLAAWSYLLLPLERDLESLWDAIPASQRKGLAGNLLNGRIQFLNTMSELALARSLKERGLDVALFSELPHGAKDADIAIRLGQNLLYLEVTNHWPECNSLASDTTTAPSAELDTAAAETNQSDVDKLLDEVLLDTDFSPIPTPTFKLVGKVTHKFSTKFESEPEIRSTGRAWVAIDFGKDHNQFLAALTQLITSKNAGYAMLAKDIFIANPEIGGVLFYCLVPNDHPACQPRVHMIPVRNPRFLVPSNDDLKQINAI